MKLRLALAVVIAWLFIPLASPASASAADCQFVLGFKALRDLIPDVVGDCVTDEQHDPANGDAIQLTTGPAGAGGLLVWRKADNWTAYTDGYWTWVNGPNGLEKRLNTERLAWEQDSSDLPGTTTNQLVATNVMMYIPQRPPGGAQLGSCWTNSAAVPHRDVWRCSVGNVIFDPCFVLDDQHVVCEPDPLRGEVGTLIELEGPLPEPAAALGSEPAVWLMELDDGALCGFATGATTGVDGKRANYLCTKGASRDAGLVLGELVRGTVWMADWAIIEIGEQGPRAVARETVPVRTVVLGPAS